MIKNAKSRSKKAAKKIGRFDRPKTSLILRHRAKWIESWESISFEEVELTEDLYNEMTCIFMKSPETSYTLNIKTGETSKSHISKSCSYGHEEEKLLSEVKNLKLQLENFENSENPKNSSLSPEEAGSDSTENITGCPIVPNSIWDELSELTLDVFENIASEIINSLIDLDNKKKESAEKLKIVENDYHESNFNSRMWLEFVHHMWPPSLKGDSTLLNNDLKNLVCGKNSKLRANLVQLERIRLALKQQKLKDKTFQIQARNEIKMILEIVKSIRQNERERLILLGEKLDKAESFHQYRNNLKKKLENMKLERDQNLKKEEAKLQKEEEKRLKIEKEKREREQAIREKMKSEIRKWRIEETRKEDEMKSYNEMVEFEKRQEFYENLPLMKEAADRREKIRLAKVEERKQYELELEEERKRKEAILDSIRAQVAIEGEIDPARLVRNTENWKNRQRENELKSNMFQVNTFSDKQIMNDKRAQFEFYMRKANIPINSYALETLKTLSPATQPRRDNVHTKLYQ